MPTYFLLGDTPRPKPRKKTKEQRAREREREKRNLEELLGQGLEVGGQRPGTWPRLSLTMAVHKKDVAAANELLKKAGVNAYHAKDGRLVIPDKAANKAVLKYRSRPGMEMVDFESFS